MFTHHPRFLRTHSSGTIAHRECVTNATATIGFWLKLTRMCPWNQWRYGKAVTKKERVDQKPVDGIRDWWVVREKTMSKSWRGDVQKQVMYMMVDHSAVVGRKACCRWRGRARKTTGRMHSWVNGVKMEESHSTVLGNCEPLEFAFEDDKGQKIILLRANRQWLGSVWCCVSWLKNWRLERHEIDILEKVQLKIEINEWLKNDT